MSQPTKIEKHTLCPSCGTKGRSVGVVTLRALLKDQHFRQPAKEQASSRCDRNDLAESGCNPANNDSGWRFCDSPRCDVVYFAEQADATFVKSDLQVEVGVKETTGDRPLCYCFGHSIASIKRELRNAGRSNALADIRAKMKIPGCRCETENPSGSCCLANVALGIKVAQEELGMTDTAPQAKASDSLLLGNRSELIAKVGTLVSAVMASACCWLPLLLLAIGVSGAGIAATLETYRPLFIIVTFGFLGTAFYLTYRPRRTVDTVSGCCPPEPTAAKDCCDSSSKNRLSMVTMNKVMLWVVTVLAVAFLFFPHYVGFLLTPSTHDEAATVIDNPLKRQTSIAIEGMHCEACADMLKHAVEGVPGVLSAKVDYGTSRAVVSTEACCAFPEDAVLKAVRDAGFTGSLQSTDE